MSDELNDSQELNPDQEQEPLSPGPEGLPWERFQGLLWGLPSTWWMIVRHPKMAFSAPAQATWMRAWGFATILLFVQYLLGFVFVATITLDRNSLGLFVSGLFDPMTLLVIPMVGLMPIQLALNTILLTALPLKALLWIFSRQSVQLTDLIRLSFYTGLIWPVILTPYPYLFISTAASTAYLHLGISSQFPGLKRASLFACASYFLIYFLINYILRGLVMPG